MRRYMPPTLLWAICLGLICVDAGYGQILLSRLPDPLPPRVLLEQPVALELEGSILQVMERLARLAERDWIVSVRSDEPLTVVKPMAKHAPLWQVLDSLRDSHSYEWGVQAGVLVAWPKLEPARERQVPEAEPATTLPDGGEPLVLGRPTPLAVVLESINRMDDGNSTYYLDPELRSWRAAGRISQLTQPKAAAIMAAVGAVGDGAGGAVILKPGGLRRLSDGLLLRQAAENETEAEAADRRALRAALLEATGARLSAQQWEYVRLGGEAQVALRELPVEAVALMAQLAEMQVNMDVDWTQPQLMYVSVSSGIVGIEQRDGQMGNKLWLSVSVNMPSVEGKMHKF